MAKRGRKAIDLPTLIWLEGCWSGLFKLMRDGHAGGVELDGLPVPSDDPPGAPPSGITNPGALHDWQKTAREDWLQKWEYHPRYSAPVAPERELWNRLTKAETARQVRQICRQSRFLGPSSFLYEHAEQFVSMLNKDVRYPRKAITKDDQRILYCARVMAAIALRRSPYTVLDKLRKLKSNE